MLLPSPNPAAALPPPAPPPHNKVKTTLGQKVARSPPYPSPTAALPPPHLCPPPCQDRGGGEKSETRTKVKTNLVSEYEQHYRRQNN
jgi:hypothetical protein